MALNNDTKSNRVSRLSIIKGAADYTSGKAPSVAGIVVVDRRRSASTWTSPTRYSCSKRTCAILPKHVLGQRRAGRSRETPVHVRFAGRQRAVQGRQEPDRPVLGELPRIPTSIAAGRSWTRSSSASTSSPTRPASRSQRGEVDYNAAPSNNLNIAPDSLAQFLAQPNLYMTRMANPVTNTLRFQPAPGQVEGQARTSGHRVCGRSQEDRRQPVRRQRGDRQLADAAPVGPVQAQEHLRLQPGHGQETSVGGRLGHQSDSHRQCVADRLGYGARHRAPRCSRSCRLLASRRIGRSWKPRSGPRSSTRTTSTTWSTFRPPTSWTRRCFWTSTTPPRARTARATPIPSSTR